RYGTRVKKASQSTIYTKADVDTALSLKPDRTYVDAQLALNANQSTTYTITQVNNILARKQPTITSSTNLTMGSITAQTNVVTPVVRTTDIDFSDVANSGATLLSIKSGTTTLLSMAQTVGIKHFTYSDFNNNYVYNIKEINGIDHILGSGIFAATRGSFMYLQASGSSYMRPTTPTVQGIYLGQASTTSSGIEMTASGETTIDFSTPGINYKGRIQ
ncbi:MAG: hypothetical protein ACKPKO_54945, partial [Candidatus Fonsibacter sp.]